MFFLFILSTLALRMYIGSPEFNCTFGCADCYCPTLAAGAPYMTPDHVVIISDDLKVDEGEGLVVTNASFLPFSITSGRMFIKNVYHLGYSPLINITLSPLATINISYMRFVAPRGPILVARGINSIVRKVSVEDAVSTTLFEFAQASVTMQYVSVRNVSAVDVAVGFDQSSFSIENSVFEDIQSTVTTFLVSQNSSGVVSSTTFRRCRGGLVSGVFWLPPSSNELLVNNCSFTECMGSQSAVFYVAGIFGLGSELHLIQSTFQYNSFISEVDGGIIIATNKYVVLELSSVSANENQSFVTLYSSASVNFYDQTSEICVTNGEPVRCGAWSSIRISTPVSMTFNEPPDSCQFTYLGACTSSCLQECTIIDSSTSTPTGAPTRSPLPTTTATSSATTATTATSSTSSTTSSTSTSSASASPPLGNDTSSASSSATSFILVVLLLLLLAAAAVAVIYCVARRHRRRYRSIDAIKADLRRASSHSDIRRLRGELQRAELRRDVDALSLPPVTTTTAARRRSRTASRASVCNTPRTRAASGVHSRRTSALQNPLMSGANNDLRLMLAQQPATLTATTTTTTATMSSVASSAAVYNNVTLFAALHRVRTQLTLAARDDDDMDIDTAVTLLIGGAALRVRRPSGHYATLQLAPASSLLAASYAHVYMQMRLMADDDEEQEEAEAKGAYNETSLYPAIVDALRPRVADRVLSQAGQLIDDSELGRAVRAALVDGTRRMALCDATSGADLQLLAPAAAAAVARWLPPPSSSVPSSPRRPRARRRSRHASAALDVDARLARARNAMQYAAVPRVPDELEQPDVPQ